MSKDDGGPAFPGFAYARGYGPSKPSTLPDGTVVWEQYEPGASLRDWFAGQALASWGEQHHRMVDSEHTVDTPREMADVCYRIADAMLREREASHDD